MASGNEPFGGLGIFPFALSMSEAYGHHIHSDIAEYAKVMKDAGARPD